jgi:thiamine-phosphate pyrophosphorylase
MPSRHPLPPLLCLTQDGLAIDHAEQARLLCEAGVRFIQIRMKDCDRAERLRQTSEALLHCRYHGALCLVNDDVGVALQCGADGVHLGRKDMPWDEARALLGPRRLLGGTVNNAEDAIRALRSGCLDYVGVGPLHFTSTKKALAPVLGLEGVRSLLRRLSPLPAWVIGGVTAQDLAGLREAGAAGAAVCSPLYRNEQIQENVQGLLHAWETKEILKS